MITDGDWETRKGRTNWEMRRRQWSCTGFTWWWYWSWRGSGLKEGRIATSPKCPTYTTGKSLHGKPSTKLIPWTISGCFVEWVVSEQAKQCRSKQCICIVWQCRAGLNLDLLRRILASCDAHLGPLEGWPIRLPARTQTVGRVLQNPLNNHYFLHRFLRKHGNIYILEKTRGLDGQLSNNGQ